MPILKQVPHLPLFLLFLLLVTGCSQHGLTGPAASDKQGGTFSLPLGVTSIPDIAKVKATLVCPDGSSVGMTIDPVTNTALGSCGGIAPGTKKTFTLHFTYGVNNIDLADATKTINVVAGNNPALTFTPDDYVTPDTDGDGFTNLYEVSYGMDSGAINYHLGGGVSGLNGTLVLGNGADITTVTSNGSFNFPVGPITGASYDAFVLAQPSGQTCTVSNGSGTVSTKNITNIVVSCIALSPATYHIGGNVSGLSGTLVLGNGTDVINITGNSRYTFTTDLTTGDTYNVVIKQQPTGYECTLSNATGTVDTIDVTNIDVSCIALPLSTYHLGGSVSGLSGTLVLQNGSESLSVGADGSFIFTTGLPTGTDYAVSVKTPPSGQSCTVGKGTGTIGNADVTDITVNCSTSTYSLGGNVSGLSGSLVLGNGVNSDTVTVNVDGSFTFAGQLASGTAYDVGVITLPNGQLCNVTNASGTIASANVTNVTVSCTSASASYQIGGNVSGLNGTLVLTNGNDTLSISSVGAFTFPTSIANGGSYAVTINTQPGGQSCNITNGSGTVNGSSITDITVNCVTLPTATWMGGTTSTTSNYGTLGLAASTNIPGGRNGSATWMSSSGQLWLFGGYGYDTTATAGNLSDLWLYDASTNEWTWMGGPNAAAVAGTYGSQGVAALNNNPGARTDPAHWIDSSGNLWLFGGSGLASVSGSFGYLNDLWKYDPVKGQWTWMLGPNVINGNGVYGSQGVTATTNNPGARQQAAFWSDTNGLLWLFGGSGYDSASTLPGSLNDLWQFDPVTNQWTWVSGDNTIWSAGNYGVQGVPASSNQPSARHGAASWIDGKGNLWLFGGLASIGTLNDMWKYDTTTHEWTWMTGTKTADAAGSSGIKGLATSSNMPSARQTAATWVDSKGQLWLLGGNGYDANGAPGDLNDLWSYDPATNQWTWWGGSSTAYGVGNYGTLGVTSPDNFPGARTEAISWGDSNGLWLFGGFVSDSVLYGQINDLWLIKP